MKMNKKGFTLVELLAVIVILAVVMLIGITAVGPLMNRARKGAFNTEIATVSKAAEEALSAEMMTNSTISSTTDYCVKVSDLCDNGYYSKGCSSSDDGYSGSVLVKADGSVRVWLYSANYSAEDQLKTDATIGNAVTNKVTDCGETGTKLTLTTSD